jgi:hypothetical protein
MANSNNHVLLEQQYNETYSQAKIETPARSEVSSETHPDYG